ncbi:hypothetical protein JSQ81_11775 [Sporosarcina sp. Marseille-Q4063]|uniref:hypothetical protein n=1 Tax=Sporosarcina sp. Marseille-Q4063 TaxID=2810514 RepID=UPI001BAF74E3|nr:hypothetical protein [Sporosarcina sp. Marseille-Q4063]QUW20537.1 hypothetical protein JSQ81_11775 [Sporosarcina sp. Marseille-Q4063]
MVILGIIRWVVLGVFLVFFYLAEFKKKKEYNTPAQLAILIGVLLHAIIRDWHPVLKIVVILGALIGLGGTILRMFKKRRSGYTS